MNKDKAAGYVLLTGGVVMILYAFISVYNIFTGQGNPVQLFTFNGIAIDLSTMIQGTPPPDVDLTQTLVEPDLINVPLNYVAHLLFMGFVSSVGYKIARVGALLVRSIKVQVRQEKEEVNITAK